MKHQQLKSMAFTGLALGLIVGQGILPALAQTSSGAGYTSPVSPPTKSTARMTRLVSRADLEIQRRVDALNKLLTRIQNMQKISDTDKTSLINTVQDQITAMNNLKSKIDADTDLQTLITDVKSIVASYRIYVLVIPQGAVIAATDRVKIIADNMSTLASKLQARITSAQSAGQDVTALQSALSDLNAKVSDATTQAESAISEVSGLVPDQGNQTSFQANVKAMKDARKKIQAAQQDLVAARKDAKVIVNGLRSLGNASSTPNPAPSSSSQ